MAPYMASGSSGQEKQCQGEELEETVMLAIVEHLCIQTAHKEVRWHEVREQRAAGGGWSTQFSRVLQPQIIFMVMYRALKTFEKILLNFSLTFPKSFIMRHFSLALSINIPRNMLETLLQLKRNGFHRIWFLALTSCVTLDK